MRFAWIILAFAVIAVAMVHLRLEQAFVRAETFQMSARRCEIRRRLWDHQIRLGELASPRQVNRRGRQLALELLPPGEFFAGDQVVRRD
ncbi:MAG: hypothetical protein SVV80_10155 [Planctomycetota bacterium]|nr:hypothetical protein [Planctomycetota bacterium]